MAKKLETTATFVFDSVKTKVIKMVEVDDDGEIIERGAAKTLGTIYLDKRAIKAAGGKKVPKKLTITFAWQERT